MAQAICPFCSATVTVEDGSLQEYKCTCGNTLTVAILREKDAFIDPDASNIELGGARQLFDEGKLEEAKEGFKRALKFNPNNFMAEYYTGLCEIAQNSENDKFNVPKALSKMFANSVIKANNSQLEQGKRITFVSTLANEVQVSLLSHFHECSMRYDNNDYQNVFRAKCIEIIEAVSELATLDGSIVCISDKSVAAIIKDIVELAVEVCFRASHSYAEGNNAINTIPDDVFLKIKKHYDEFSALLKSIDKKYKSPHKIDFNDNIMFNREVASLVVKYYELNRDNRKARLAITGGFLEELERKCITAVHLTHFTCVRNVGVDTRDSIRNELIVQAIEFGLEVIKPRFYIDSKHRISLIVKDLGKQRFITEFLDLMAQSLSGSALKAVGDAFKGFYDDVLATVKMHYVNNKNKYDGSINRLKSMQNAEFGYYLGFLFNLSLACSPALTSTVGFTKFKKKSRIALLKQCRLICEEFLLLTDYRIPSIEQSRYKDIISIYGALDRDIVYLKV